MFLAAVHAPALVQLCCPGLLVSQQDPVMVLLSLETAGPHSEDEYKGSASPHAIMLVTVVTHRRHVVNNQLMKVPEEP